MPPTVDDALGARGQPAGLLKAAVDTISENQTLTFQPYVRLVLPADGYVFWVRPTLISSSAMGLMLMNGEPLNSNDATLLRAPFTVQGSVHYGSDMRQEETASFSLNKIAFTSQDRIQQFNVLGPDITYIASFRGMRFAFSTKGMFYEQMKLLHYEGDAIYPYMESQIIDDPRTFNSNQVIVSNSLPSWLSLPYYDPPYPVDIPIPRFPLYPSFLNLQNAVPPYGTVHIGPDDTTVDQDIPDVDCTLSQNQLSRDRVKVTLYGLNNNIAQDWLYAVIGFIRDAGQIGLANMPSLRDEKKTQRELLTIAMAKSVNFEVSYNQRRIRDVARQLIESVCPPETSTINGHQFITQL